MSLNSAFIIIATSVVSLGLFIHQNMYGQPHKEKPQVVVVKEGMRLQENFEQSSSRGRVPASVPFSSNSSSILSSKNP